MKAVKSNIYRKVRVVLNTERADRPQWAKIIVEWGSSPHRAKVLYSQDCQKEV